MMKKLIILLIITLCFTKTFFDQKQIVDDSKCTINDVLGVNEEIYQILKKIRKTTFFKIFKVDLESECPFWAMKYMCSSSGGCTVCKCDENEVPIPWKISKTNEIVKQKGFFKLKDKWIDDERNLWFKKQNESKMTYVNLLLNIEGTLNK
jgi:ERO1-like protein alpha